MAARKPTTLTVRLADNVRAANGGPYPISLTAIVERGIVLAVAELDEMAGRARPQANRGSEQ